nr:uncharacterized protein At5g08430-like [Ipomoea trifida]GLL35256.1 uncharacterized protein At5g08430-like [Ipomoea trifida]GLL35257.1 uncharacterized protein At5g08430-like [Ipomoea trifida]
MKVQNKKRKSRRNKLEFLGWGSKPLIEFLDSIGKESRQYSQGEVDAIKKKYVACNNLIDPTYKRRILCNERLEKLFEKKIVSRKNVYHLLEVHFRENHVVVDDDAQDNAPPLFSLRLTLRFFQSVTCHKLYRDLITLYDRLIFLMEFGSGSNKIKVQNKKRKSRRNKLEFLGWGSKPLIEFLDSIGKESRQYSQGEVDAIRKKYVACNNLIDQTYHRRIMCDERLEKLFKKKIVSRKNVCHLREVYFRENHVVVDDDAQDNAPPLFSLRLTLRFFQSGEVDAITKKYVACNNLIDPTYHRRIMCDERLEKLFKKKIVSRKNVYHLREVYFRENHVVVDDDAQDNAPPLFSLRLTLRFFQSGNFFNQI